MPTIPTGLRPVVEGYGFTGPGGVNRTEVAGGMPRYALAWDRGVQQFRVTLILDPVEFSVWSVFFHHSIKKGSLSFDMHLDSGFGPALHTVNMLPDTYTVSRAGGVNSVVSFGVEAESQAYAMTPSEVASLLALFEAFGPGSSTLLARVATFANVDTLVLSP